VSEQTTERTISFRDLPRTSRLYHDFLYDFERVARFYHGAGPDGNLAALVSRVAEVTSQTFAREEICAVLAEQNLAAGGGELTRENIALLGEPDSVVIITGQQAGLFSGPLYTLYKALTVIKLAARLRERGVKAVPMFWIAAEDHDFEEVNHTRIVNREGQLVTVTYTACSPKEGKPVGAVRLAAGIEENVAQLISALPESEFVPQLAADLRAAYHEGAGFADAFGVLMMKLLGRFGVVMINPLDDRLKAVAGAIYERALERAPEFAAALVAESRALETAGYHAQVHTSDEAVPLFMVDEGRRTALVRRENGDYHLKGSEKKYGAGELLDLVRGCPSCFSPNVTLRPLVQDFLLPTLAYIGGPAEIAYFAQLRPGYALLGRVEPVVLPRASLTLVEKRHARTMDKYRLGLNDLFAGPEAVLAKAVEGGMDAATGTAFEESVEVISAQLERLRASLAAADPTLAEALKGGREKILYQLQHLRTRFIHNRGQRDETLRQQIDRLCTVLYPDRNLQERELNAAYFLARYGPQLLDRLYQEIEPGARDHQLVFL
jgi:bacillithiol biosynthesis cysteine-adding enzyme BshC